MILKYSLAVAIAATGLSAVLPAAAAPLPQHAGHHADALNATLTARLGTVETKVAAAREARRITPAQAAEMRKRLAWVRKDSAKYVKQQGFLSAGESASYNRTLDGIEAKLAG